MISKLVLSLDIDWAPTFIIDYVLNILLEKNVKATWFITHQSPAIDRIRDKSELFELGIHPNFLMDSTHGSSIEEVINTITKIVPDAIVSRNHASVQSGLILSEIARLSSIKIDSSIFLPEMPNIIPIKHLTPYGELIRIPFFWSDDYELLKKTRYWSINKYLSISGYKIFLFHPIHVFLNSSSIEEYQILKAKFTNLGKTKYSDLKEFVNDGKGIRSMFMDIIAFMTNKTTYFLTDIAEQYFSEI